MNEQQLADLRQRFAARANGASAPDEAGGELAAAISEARIVTLEEFVAVDEPGAAPLLGDEHGALIPQGGDVMVYGDGGAGKTTLLFDLACHLAAGRDWLGIPVARPVRVLLIENEGPRSLLRKKLRRKVDGWRGPALEGRVTVLEEPWGEFTFATEQCQAKLAEMVREHEVDVLIAGPLTRLGMNTPGTLQEVAAFMRLVGEVRRQSGRGLTPIIVHHENKGGTVSGAWEGAGDTLLHVQGAGNGHTVVYVQKARWSSAHHDTTLKLAWTEGESFALEGDRDYVAEVVELLSDGRLRTAKEIADTKDKGGIGANVDAIKQLLAEHPERFEQRTGDAAKAAGRRPNAIIWKLTQAPESVESEWGSPGGAESNSDSDSPLKGVRVASAPPTSALETDSDRQVRWHGEPAKGSAELQALVDAEREDEDRP